MTSTTAAHGEPGHEHAVECLAMVTLNWVCELFALSGDLGYDAPTPYELLAYTVAATAKLTGYVVPPQDYQRLLVEHAEPLRDLIRQRYNLEFEVITQK